MSVYLPHGCTTWYYDFTWRGHRYRDTTHQTRKEDAALVEAKLKLRLRQQAAGIAPFDPADTPRFQDWAEVYLAYQKRFSGRPDLVKRALQVVLEFWGARPATPKKAPAVPRAARVAPPYHNLRLGDPIADPTWLLRFQAWIDARHVSGSTANSYLSAMSGMYRVALQPEYRAAARIETNPFRDVRRSDRNKRVVALEPSAVLRWVEAASYHVALAVTIGALAPKLRLQSILGLRWDLHVDADLTRITVVKHKTARHTGVPQVTPISAQLRAVLDDARSRSTSPHLITFHGEPVSSIKRGARRAAEAAGLVWGMPEGVTFHTLRHSIATLLARVGMPERLRMELMGHSEIRTTQQYTHLAAEAQVVPHEELSAAMPLQDAMLAKPRPSLPSRPEVLAAGVLE